MAIGGIFLVIVGAGLGRASRGFELYGHGGTSWSADRVVVAVTHGSTVAALAAAAAVCALVVASAVGMQLALVRQLPADRRRQGWTIASSVIAVAGVAATVVGFATRDVDDAPPATWIVSTLVDDDRAEPELVSGYVATGVRAGERPRLPATIAFVVDGRACTLVVADPISLTDGTVTLSPTCDGSALPAPPAADAP